MMMMMLLTTTRERRLRNEDIYMETSLHYDDSAALPCPPTNASRVPRSLSRWAKRRKRHVPSAHVCSVTRHYTASHQTSTTPFERLNKVAAGFVIVSPSRSSWIISTERRLLLFAAFYAII